MAVTFTENIDKSRKDINFLFNFDQDFISSLEQISPTDLATAMPHFSLAVAKMNGQKLANLSLDWFQKPIEFDKIGDGDRRYGDRPLLSLKDVSITTDNASGYLYYTNVEIKFVVHRPDLLASSILVSVLFPGTPLLMEYGWKNFQDSALTQIQKLLLSVISYDLNFDPNGEINLTVSCSAFNDRLSAIYIGDTLKEDSNENVSEAERGGLVFIKSSLEDKLKSFEEILENKENKPSNDFDLVRQAAENVRFVLEVTNRKISDNFATYVQKTEQYVLSKDVGKRKYDYISFGNLVYAMCGETLDALSQTIPGGKVEVIYGKFNQKSGDFSNKSIAEFPIEYSRFLQIVKSYREAGNSVTVSNFFSTIIREFLEDKGYWLSTLQNNKNKPVEFNNPDVVVLFINNGDKFYICLMDAKFGLPITTASLPKGKSSTVSAQKEVLKGTSIPVILYGKATSYIKNLTLSQTLTPEMKAGMIKRARDAPGASTRNPYPYDALNKSVPTSPLTLPLQGSLTVFGHIDWKPFRAFYLDVGIYVVNGIYKISKVTHVINSEGFESQIDFVAH